MNCQQCGKPVNLGARFCGACGTAVGPLETTPTTAATSSERSLPPPSSAGADVQIDADARNRLREGLRSLAALVPSFGISSAVTEALTVLAQGPGADRHTTAVLGEKARGKTTLINRLLGEPVLPTGGKSLHQVVRLRAGPAWRTTAEEPAATASPPTEGVDIPRTTVMEGPAALLAYTTLVDTPGMNDADAEFDRVVIGEAFRADLLIFCLSAAQLLSETERLVIRKRLLPVTACNMVLAVTHMDLAPLEERAELESRVARFVERTGVSRLKAVSLPGNPDESLAADGLMEMITMSATQTNPAREQAWAKRSRALLTSLNDVVSKLPEPPANPEELTQDGATDALALLDQEHELALSETEALVRSRLAHLRVTLPERFAGMRPETVQHEGLAELAGEVQAVAREAGSFYLSALEQGVNNIASSADAAPALQQFYETAAPHLAAMGRIQQLHFRAGSKPPADARLAALAVLGVTLVTTMSTIVPVIGGALALYTAHSLRRARNQQFGAKLRTDAAAAVREWLTEVESAFLGRLHDAAKRVHGAMREQVRTPSSVAARPLERPTLTTLQEQIRGCLDCCRTLMPQGEQP